MVAEATDVGAGWGESLLGGRPESEVLTLVSWRDVVAEAAAEDSESRLAGCGVGDRRLVLLKSLLLPLGEDGGGGGDLPREGPEVEEPFAWRLSAILEQVS